MNEDLTKNEEKIIKKTAEKLAEVGLDDFARYLRSPWHIIWTNFIAGVFRGLGFVIGATVVLAFVAFVLVKVLGGLPVVGEWFQQVGTFFQDIQNASQTFQQLKN